MKVVAQFDPENITAEDLEGIRKMLAVIANHVEKKHARLEGKSTTIEGVSIGRYVYNSDTAEQLHKSLGIARKALRLGRSLKDILI